MKENQLAKCAAHSTSYVLTLSHKTHVLQSTPVVGFSLNSSSPKLCVLSLSCSFWLRVLVIQKERGLWSARWGKACCGFPSHSINYVRRRAMAMVVAMTAASSGLCLLFWEIVEICEWNLARASLGLDESIRAPLDVANFHRSGSVRLHTTHRLCRPGASDVMSFTRSLLSLLPPPSHILCLGVFQRACGAGWLRSLPCLTLKIKRNCVSVDGRAPQHGGYTSVLFVK